MSFKIPSILPDQEFNCGLESLGVLKSYNAIIGEVNRDEPNNQVYIESFLSKLSPMALMYLGLDRISIDILSNQLTDFRGLIPRELMDYIIDNTYTETEPYQLKIINKEISKIYIADELRLISKVSLDFLIEEILPGRVCKVFDETNETSLVFN